jgi:hypothetical protein
VISPRRHPIRARPATLRPSQRAAEHVVERIGGLAIFERKRVRMAPQCRRSVAMTESLLGVSQVAGTDEERRNTVTSSITRRVHICRVAEPLERATATRRLHARLMCDVRRE